MNIDSHTCKRTLAWASALFLASACGAPEITYIEKPATPIGQFNEDVVGPVLEDGFATLSGQVKDLLNGNPVSGATVNSFGVTPPATSPTDGAGGYAMEIQAAGLVWAEVSGPGFVSTYDQLFMPAVDTTKNFYVMTQADLDQVAATYGVTLYPGCANIFVEATYNAVAQAGISGVSVFGAGVAVEARGPYFFNGEGAAGEGYNETQASGKLVFLNVCDEGVQTLSATDVQVQLDQVNYAATPQFLKVFPGALTRSVLEVSPVDGPPPPPPPPVAIDFPTEVMPVFTRNQCAACHTQGGAADGTGLYFDGPVENVYATLTGDPAIVNIQNPGISTVLTKPLFEDPPNHPNAAFNSPEHPDYIIIYNWISGGAVYGVNPPPPPVDLVDFDNAIYPIFQNAADYPGQGRGCIGCHDTPQAQGGLVLDDGAAAVYQRLVDNGFYDLQYPDRSSILRNPYCGPDKCVADEFPETHPTEVFVVTADPGYQTILQWVSQGAQRTPPIVDPNLPVNVDFTDNIYPRLQRNGCIGCHNGVQAAGGLILDGTPAEVHAQMLNGRVIANDYAASSMFTKPNAEYPEVNHGGGKQVANNDTDYARYMRAWIDEGANFVAPLPVNFSQDVAPLFAAAPLNCTGCHGNDGGLTLNGAPQAIYDELRVENPNRAIPQDPANSTILTKASDLFADVNHAGGKRAIYDAYKENAIIWRWILEGANFQ